MNTPTAIININHLKHNIRYIKSSINKSTDIIPVIKANAYGHGYKKIAEILKSEKIKCVGVATPMEIVEILNLNLNLDVLHLGKIFKENLSIYNNNSIATINSFDDIKIIQENKNINIRCHIKVDTGMNRMGCRLEDLEKILDSIKKINNINVEGIYSHLACSENKNSKQNVAQINIFKNIIQTYNDREYSFHLLNSGGIFNYPDFHLDFIRTGLSVYGISPYGKIDKFLKPVMKFVAPVILIKNINKGEKIGYGCTFISPKSMKIGIVQCGYADGVPLSFSNKGFVYYKKEKLSILGKVSMDLLCIDLTNLKSIKLGDSVTLWGDINIHNTYLENISNDFNSIPYVYLTNLSNRVKRMYVEE